MVQSYSIGFFFSWPCSQPEKFIPVCERAVNLFPNTKVCCRAVGPLMAGTLYNNYAGRGAEMRCSLGLLQRAFGVLD